MSESPVRDPLVPPSIRRRGEAPRQDDAVGFRALRTLGIAATQAASGLRWTDYNVHDPGVTILEQLSYALTEVAYRADLPVPDHMCRPDGTIDFERQALFSPEEIFPCRATTDGDYRRLLLDKVPDLADARFVTVDRVHGGPATPGLHRLRLRRVNARAAKGVGDLAAKALEIYRANRTVGEDLDDDIHEIEPRFCELALTASIWGVRDPNDILAEIYRVLAAKVAGLPRKRSVAERVLEGQLLEDALEGPDGVEGLIAEADLGLEDEGRLLITELRAEVLGVDGVDRVMSLEIILGDQRFGSESDKSVLDWKAAEWAPCLSVPGDRPHDHEENARLVGLVKLLRRDVAAPLDPRAVASRRPAALHPVYSAVDARRDFEKAVPPPKGVHRPDQPFRSVQEEFPPLYRLGRYAAPTGGLGQTDQLRGYLALFDQLLANTGEQLAHIRELFTPEQPLRQSYWRRILKDVDVPRVEALYRPSPDLAGQPVAQQIDQQVYQPFDNAADRRSRAFDYLLSLYGESCSQNTLRQFLDYLDSTELTFALLENKAAYLHQTVALGRDRAAGFDTTKALWSDPQDTTGLHRRIALLLGFRHWSSRRLTAGIAAWGAPRAAPQVTARALAWPDPADDPGAIRRGLRPDPAAIETARPTLEALRRAGAGQADLFRYGLNRERYRWEASGLRRLVLVDDAEAPCCVLGEFATEADAARQADTLRQGLLALTDACEGLHIVDHVLLRPREPGQTLDPAFHALRATVVFPGWTARTARPDFHAFAQETVDINFPAHVTAGCLWLGVREMARFERDYARWAGLLRAYQAPDVQNPAETRSALDAAAANLVAFLKARSATGQGR